MNSILNVTYTWDKESISANGAEQVRLLIEWGCGSVRRRRKGLQAKTIGSDLQLRLTVENGITLTGIEGIRIRHTQSDSEKEFVLHCGDIRKGKYKYAILTFSFPSHATGRHTAGSGEWSWRKPLQEKRTIIRSERLYINYTHHLGFIRLPPDRNVEKYAKMNETYRVLKKALRTYEKGEAAKGSCMLRRHADELLILAARNGDLDYLEEAEMIFSIRHKWNETFES